MSAEHKKELLRKLFPDEDGKYHIGKLYSTSPGARIKNYEVLMLASLEHHTDSFLKEGKLNIIFLLQDGKTEPYFYYMSSLWYLKKLQ